MRSCSMQARGGGCHRSRSRVRPNEWAPVHSSIAGPYIFVLGEGFLVDTSSMSGPDRAWPLRFDPVGMVGLLAAQCDEQLLFTSTCAETLPLSKVTGLCRWRHAPLQEWLDGHSSVPLPAARPHDWTPIPLGRGSRTLRYPDRCSVSNAAADRVCCQVKSGLFPLLRPICAGNRRGSVGRQVAQSIWVFVWSAMAGLELPLRGQEIQARMPRLDPTAIA